MARLEHERVKFKEIKGVDEKKFASEAVKMNQEFIELTTEKMHI